MFSGRTHFARSLVDFKSSCTFASNEMTAGGNSNAMKVRMFGGMLLIEYFRLHIGYFLMFYFYVKKIKYNQITIAKRQITNKSQ